MEALVLAIEEVACLVAGEQFAVSEGGAIERGGENGIFLSGFHVFFESGERIVADEEERTWIAGLRIDSEIVLWPLGCLESVDEGALGFSRAACRLCRV